MALNPFAKKTPLAQTLAGASDSKHASADSALDQADSLIQAATEKRAKADRDRAHAAALAEASRILQEAGVEV